MYEVHSAKQDFEESSCVFDGVGEMREPLFGVFVTSHALYETYPCGVTCNKRMYPPPTCTTVVLRYIVVVMVDATSLLLVTETN